MAAMTLSDISYWKNARNASVTNTSCSVAIIEPSAKLTRNRNAIHAVMPSMESSVA